MRLATVAPIKIILDDTPTANHYAKRNNYTPGCEKLSGDEKYRLGQGNYRVLYQIRDAEVVVVVVKVRYRRKVYR